ncbi:hypothetical protein PGT21_019059 [Puccinia graminis f. sp. tritici]|uniref:Uncharacterized protein n=1 Tax=Puccinia graminis f. sp. tritici TaxID=56615 RepID=A0A5B0MHY4_PUCGR|nr:hypothetical protein PGT21_019059 [Puccinia graminis f. sp. tritici]
MAKLQMRPSHAYTGITTNGATSSIHVFLVARPSGATEELKALLCQAQDSQKVLQKLIPRKELEEFVKGWNPWTIKKELYPSAPKKNDGKKRSSSSKEVKQLYNDPNRWKKVMRGCNTLEAAYRHMAD